MTTPLIDHACASTAYPNLCAEISKRLGVAITGVRRVEQLRFYRGRPIARRDYVLEGPRGAISLTAKRLTSQARFGEAVMSEWSQVPPWLRPQEWRDVVRLILEAAFTGEILRKGVDGTNQTPGGGNA